MKEPLKAKMEIIAENLKDIREFRNYTQDYLAAKLGISQNAYSKVELNYSRLTVERMFQIMEILDVEVTTVLCFDRTEFRKVIPIPENLPKRRGKKSITRAKN